MTQGEFLRDFCLLLIFAVALAAIYFCKIFSLE